MIHTTPHDETTIRTSGSATVYEIDPLQDLRWTQFIENHPGATAFHTTGWLKCLRQTYGQKPLVLTTTPEGQPLQNGIVFCKVQSWLTGKRLVSLPFSDHCQPLVDDPADLHTLLQYLEQNVRRNKLKYGELRPLSLLGADNGTPGYPSVNETVCIHMLDMRPSLEQLLKNTHKTAVQGSLKRAKKEALVIEKGRSEKLLREFYRLMVITRRKHGVPPQPYDWFVNMLECMGDLATIRVAYKGDLAIASILTLRYKKIVSYKYGCSDNAHGNLGGTVLLIWDAIEESRNQGAETLDFGRSDLDNPGLIQFKDRWGGVRSPLLYYRYGSGAQAQAEPGKKSWKSEMAWRVFSHLPNSSQILVGKFLYRHAG